MSEKKIKQCGCECCWMGLKEEDVNQKASVFLCHLFPPAWVERLVFCHANDPTYLDPSYLVTLGKKG
jgi:hypothetical protein